MDPHIRKEVSLDAKGEFFSALVHESKNSMDFGAFKQVNMLFKGQIESESPLVIVLPSDFPLIISVESVSHSPNLLFLGQLSPAFTLPRALP